MKISRKFNVKPHRTLDFVPYRLGPPGSLVNSHFVAYGPIDEPW
jgi:hypothetical protein